MTKACSRHRFRSLHSRPGDVTALTLPPSYGVVFARTDTGFDELLSLRANDLLRDGVFQAIGSGLSHAQLVLIHFVLAGALQGFGIDLQASRLVGAAGRVWE
jgi:hypothetical protein